MTAKQTTVDPVPGLLESRPRLPHFLGTPGLELLLFGGKGGTGKSTCAAATALFLATRAPAETFLVVSIDPAHSLRDSFAGDPLPPNLKLLEIDAGECFRKFKETYSRHLGQIALRGTFLDAGDVGQLLELSIPGLDEVMAFDEISLLLERHAYCRIIVDTAPTGHTLRFLELPQMLRKWLGVLDAMLAKHRYLAKLYRGSYRRDETDLFLWRLQESFERLASVLGDPARCLFVPVMLAEPLSVSETQRLVGRLERMQIPVREIVVNQIYPSGGECPVCRGVRGQQAVELHQLRREFSRYTLWQILVQGAEVRGVGRLTEFWNEVRAIEEPVGESPLHPLAPRVERPAALPGPETCLLVFAGKGGVGKTTLASATALRLAEAYPDKNLLLVSTDPACSLSDCLDVRLGPGGTRVYGRLTAMQIDAEAEFAELKKQYAEEVAEFFDRLLSGQTVVDLEFEREVMERILDLSPPGLDELMAIARVVALLGSGGDNILVLDTAPTGHLVRLLELPGLVQDWLRVMFGLFLKHKHVFWLPRTSDFLVNMSKKMKVLLALLANPRRARLHAVSISTEMALEETRDLLGACRRVGIGVPLLFLNLATPPGQCPLCSDRFRAESEIRREFQAAFTDVHQCVVYWCGERRGLERLTELGRVLYTG